MSANDDSRLNTQIPHSIDPVELKRRKIRQLNDRLRKTMQGGLFGMTRGVSSLDVDTRNKALREIAYFSQFDHKNDPFNEHDYGRIKIEGHEILWKIDYYDLDMIYASSDPSNPDVTTRVLTIMMAVEY